MELEKHRGMDVPDEPPHDPRRDMDAVLKASEKDLIPFAKYHMIDTSLCKEELLERCKPKDKKPNFPPNALQFNQ